MAGDRTLPLGRSKIRARNVELDAGVQQFNDRLNGSNPNHLFRFNLKNRSSVNFSLNRLRANANLQLLDGNGQILQTSARGGRNAESIQAVLDAGSYQVRVFTGGRSRSGTPVKTRYTLQIATAAAPTANPITPPPAPDAAPIQPAGSFNIQFDYRFDTQGWFTPERRATLEAAARIWESIIVNDFPDVPAGTPTPYVLNPETGEYAGVGSIFTTDGAIDDLTIFVGSREFGGNTLATGTPSGNFTNENRYVGSQFQPWIGSVSFDRDTDWFFDPTPTTDNDIPWFQNDFLSTAVHEIAHVLGFNRSANAFRSQVANGAFVGANAIALNGGNPIPLQSGGAHILDGYEFGGSGETLMDPTSSSGGRQLPTMLDAAILNDLGYQINYSATYRNLTANARSSSPRIYGTCGCTSCLMMQMSPVGLNQVGSSNLTHLINPGF
ncbi:MAG: pre-peptidase C-terminal domain-containing protein [Oculatellaceae cyanobacterium Prado106]|jgi:hypothetical protein|nr:pre-peptidase C-terminal domain-containing protein [Oculatellaceae cyanobacterium Prado106]